jgi:Flp pilus assembly protein TadG
MVMKAKRPPARKSQSGSAMLELALFLPVAVLLLLGSSDFARVFYAAIETTNASRAGAGYGIQSKAKSQDVTGMRDAAVADAANLTGVTATAERFCECSSGLSISCSSTCLIGTKRIYVRVRTQKTFTTLARYPAIPSSINLSVPAVMRVQ